MSEPVRHSLIGLSPLDRRGWRHAFLETGDKTPKLRSMVTPMGVEMYYRYQESLIEDAAATLSTFLRRPPEALLSALRPEPRHDNRRTDQREA